MKPAARSQLTSSPIARCLSVLKRQSDCFIGQTLGSKYNLCSTSSLGTPGMSDGFHAKMSQFSQRNSIGALSYALLRCPLTVTCWLESPGMRSTRRVSTAGSNEVFVVSLR
jgi:hypothetical protein